MRGWSSYFTRVIKLTMHTNAIHQNPILTRATVAQMVPRIYILCGLLAHQFSAAQLL
jgi:hypothetical protein